MEITQDSRACGRMTPTPEQLRQALINTHQKPRNHAAAIYAAIRNEKTACGGGLLNVLAGHHNKDKGACYGRRQV